MVSAPSSSDGNSPPRWPFDEPNVAEAKAKTNALLKAFSGAGRFPDAEPRTRDEDVAVFTRAYAGNTPVDVIRAAVDSLKPGDYVAFLSYLPADAAVARAVAEVRRALRSRARVATTFGVGPRYLHSTGQYHKGGPNNPLAFLITADDETQTDVPDAGYSFSVLKRAQALGDFETLEAHGRRVVRIHVEGSDHAAAIERLFASALA
jgi:transaldolase/glucose-6-phosphate isomerase